ncbi:MAG TPA: hypothetical protein VNI61_02850 [Gemmatimonadales bacterium]|nr:hypothetical protein [Gemmatimonadales bacterium]
MRRSSYPLVAIGALGLAGCTTLGPVTAPQEYVAARRPAALWVTLTDGALVRVEAPRFLGDTLVGFVDGGYREFLPGDIDQVRAKRPAGGRTAALVASLAAGGAALIAVLASSGPQGRLPTPEDDPTNP